MVDDIQPVVTLGTIKEREEMKKEKKKKKKKKSQGKAEVSLNDNTHTGMFGFDFDFFSPFLCLSFFLSLFSSYTIHMKESSIDR